jgi:hypothetical protein
MITAPNPSPAAADGGRRIDKAMNRRQALAKLGLAVAVAYAAPTVTRLDRQALAANLPSGFCVPGRPGCGPPGKGKG